MRKLNLYNLYTSFGQQRTGVEYGPYYLKELGIEEVIKTSGYQLNQTTDIFGSYHFNKWQSIVEMTHELTEMFAQKKAADFELFVGGDHSLAFSTLAALEVDQETVVIWLDAHPDMNTISTSDTGNLHGMPLAYTMGYGEGDDISKTVTQHLKADNIFLVGIRSIDESEAERIATSGAHAYPSSYIAMNETWLADCVAEIAARTKKVHLSFDIDSLDAALVPGTGTPVENGLSLELVLAFIQELKKKVTITSADLVEVNPYLDNPKDCRTGHRALTVLKEILK